MAAQTVLTSVRGLGCSSLKRSAPVSRSAGRHSVVVRAEKAQVVQPLNGDPFIGMLETPVTSAPAVANFLSSLPAYRTGVSPLLRGVEIGLVRNYSYGCCC